MDKRPKRANFTSIQNSATTFLTKAVPLPVRTGYERVLAHRTNDLFAKTARLDGQVVSMKDGVLVVRYSDNQEVGYQLGRRFGRWGGDNLPHSIKTTLREGQTFKKGDLLVYNENYFKVDKLFRGQAVYKGGVIGRFIFMEIPETLEDSQVIHERFAEKLVTKTTHIQTLYAKHYQEIVNLVNVGDVVDTSSILCTITSPIGSGEEGVYDDETMAFLRDNASASPGPDYPGVIEKIETIYTGEVDTMTPTLRELVERGNTQLYRVNRRLKRNISDSRVEVGFRSGKTTMEDEMVLIRVYITTEQPMGAGDKGVVANQLKSIVASRVTGLMETLDGRPADGIFAYQSADNRIVNSAISLGIYTTFCVHATEEAVSTYFD